MFMTTSTKSAPRTATITNNTTPADDRISLAGKRLHFVGVGGCGMSGLARMAKQRGAICTGTDLSGGETIDMLGREGIAVTLEQTAESVPDACDQMVISAAIKAEHPEVAEAQRRGVTVIKYAAMLGRLMVGQRGIAVAGTHGKSSTTSMLSHVLIQCGLDPSLIVGANCRQIGGGARVGKSDLLVAEACEYDRSFHNLRPTHAIILNVEEDHLDMYSGIDEIVASFAEFARLLPKQGTLLINHEMPHRMAITAGLNCAVETIGFAPQADWQVKAEGSKAVLLHRGETVASWTSLIPGDHMAYNAAAAAITANRLGAGWSDIAAALATFQGLDRRMQLMGRRAIPGGFVTVIDDYGHHPTEIDTTLRALRRHYQPKRLVCVFQPHQHSRTRFLMEQFAVSFSEADVVVVPHIYFVRDSEKERHAVRSADLVDRLRQRGRQAMHLYPFEAIVEQLELICRDGDLLVTMGAGDVWKVARDFLSTGEQAERH